MHHIGIGEEHAGKAIRMLIHDLAVIIIERETGAILRELTIDPDRDNQPRGPKPGSPRTGGMPKGYHYNKPRNMRKSRDIRYGRLGTSHS